MIGARMPAVSQVGEAPASGGSAITQRRQAVWPGQDRHRLPLGTQATAIDPGYAQLRRGVVDQEADLEIVGAVDDAVDSLAERLDVGVIDIHDDRFDLDGGIDTAQFICRGDRLG